MITVHHDQPEFAPEIEYVLGTMLAKGESPSLEYLGVATIGAAVRNRRWLPGA